MSKRKIIKRKYYAKIFANPEELKDAMALPSFVPVSNYPSSILPTTNEVGMISGVRIIKLP